MSKAEPYFGSLDYTTTVLQNAFGLLKESQIEHFKQDIIRDLVGGDHDALRQLESRPSIKARTSSDQLSIMAAECQRINPEINLENYYLQNELSDQDLSYFNYLGISSPLSLQQLCYNFCTSPELKGRWLVQLETGSGKTALSFTIASDHAARGYNVLIVNDSAELTFRDFKRAETG